MKTKQLLLSAALGLASSLAFASQIVTQWNFDDDTLNPSLGSGTASNIGGTTTAFAAGSPGRGWNTSSYPSQGVGSGTAGVQFFVSTAGFTDVQVSFDHRASGTASRWAQLDYTLDGGENWVTGFWNNGGGLSPHDSFYSFSVDLTSVTVANNNPDFGFRIVSIFSPLAFNENSVNSFGANEAYMRANANAQFAPDPGTQGATSQYGTSGTWRFDNVTVTAIPEPSTVLLLVGGLAILAGVRRRK